MTDNDNKLLGVVLLVRHGDRQGFYQDPDSYAPSDTGITPLGTQQEYQLGQLLRQRYLTEISPTFIAGINSTIVDDSQIRVRADAGGEGGVIYNSAMALLQGLFPATETSRTSLANGTTVVAPLGGYQYIPIESVEPDNDISLEGWTSCQTFVEATNAFYDSPIFKAKEQENAAFLSQLREYVDGRPVSLQNMWNIYDYMKVQSIHNPDFSNRVPPSVFAKVQDLANFHEYGIFTSARPGGIGNIAGRTIIPSILDGFERIANSSDSLKLVYQAISYKPFISLFNMTAVTQQNAELAGIVNFAAAVALEVRSSSDGPVVRFNFKNGTDEDEFTTYNMFGASSDVPLSSFIDHLAPVAINDTALWCTECHNIQDRGCGALNIAAEQAISSQQILPIGAGFLGAGLGITFMLIIFFILASLRIVKVDRRNKKNHIQNPRMSEGDSYVGKIWSYA